jgi:hypothetical protein
MKVEACTEHILGLPKSPFFRVLSHYGLLNPFGIHYFQLFNTILPTIKYFLL